MVFLVYNILGRRSLFLASTWPEKCDKADAYLGLGFTIFVDPDQCLWIWVVFLMGVHLVLVMSLVLGNPFGFWTSSMGWLLWGSLERGNIL